MTQADLGDKLGYTDKAVSKWERGEAIPDIETLRALAGLFGITVDELISERRRKKVLPRRALVPLLSSGIVWLVATVIFVFIRMFLPNPGKVWLAFVYAVPISAIICLVFSCIWRNRIGQLVTETALVWSIALAVFLSFPVYAGKEFIFLVPLPLQTLAVLWFVFRLRK